MTMKILLVSPTTPETFWSFKHVLRFVSKRAAFPPLGLLTVAAMLPADWQVKLVDMNVNPLSDDDLRWADFVLLSAMIVHKASVSEVVNRCRRMGVPVIAGGPLFTTGHAAFPDIDHFVMDEAEELIRWRTQTGAKMGFFTEASANLADDAGLCELMVRAGFKKVFVGFETPSLESLKECRKLQNCSRDLVETVKTLQRAGLEVMGGFIVGFDKGARARSRMYPPRALRNQSGWGLRWKNLGLPRSNRPSYCGPTLPRC